VGQNLDNPAYAGDEDNSPPLSIDNSITAKRLNSIGGLQKTEGTSVMRLQGNSNNDNSQIDGMIGSRSPQALLDRTSDKLSTNDISLQRPSTGQSTGYARPFSRQLPQNKPTNGHIPGISDGTGTIRQAAAGKPATEGTQGNTYSIDSATNHSKYIVVFDDKAPMRAKASKDLVKSLVRGMNGKVVHEYNVINGIAVSIPEDGVADLKNRPDVKYVEKD
jgi:hypothetical protein